MLNFYTYVFLHGCEGTYMVSNSFAFLRFGIQPIVNCVCCHYFSLLLLFQGEVAYQNFTPSEPLEGGLLQCYS